MTTDTTLTTAQVRVMAERYHELKGAAYLIPETGEKLAAWEYDREVKALRDALSGYIADNGSFHLEGVGEFRLQERTTMRYDLKAMRQFRPELFDALVELDCVSVDNAKAKAHSERLSGLKQLGIPGGTMALVVEKRG